MDMSKVVLDNLKPDNEESVLLIYSSLFAIPLAKALYCEKAVEYTYNCIYSFQTLRVVV